MSSVDIDQLMASVGLPENTGAASKPQTHKNEKKVKKEKKEVEEAGQKEKYKKIVSTIDYIIKDAYAEQFTEDDAQWFSLQLGRELVLDSEGHLSHQDTDELLRSKQLLEQGLKEARNDLDHHERQRPQTEKKLLIPTENLPEEISAILKKWPSEVLLDEEEEKISDDEWRRRSSYNKKILEQQEKIVQEISKHEKLNEIKAAQKKALVEALTDDKTTNVSHNASAPTENPQLERLIFFHKFLQKSEELEKLRRLKEYYDEVVRSDAA